MKGKISIIIAAFIVVTTAISVWYEQRPAVPKEASWDDVIAESTSGGYRIISTDKLADLYHKAPENLLLVDTRQQWEYRTGHIKGALNFPMEPTWWSRWSKAGELEDLLGSDKEKLMVFY